MKCEQATTMFSDLLEQQLSPDSRQQLAAHLQNCDACRQQLQGFENSMARLQQWQEVPAPAWDRSLGGQVAGSSSGWWQWPAGFAWRWSPLAMSFVLALAVLFNLQVSVGQDHFQLTFGGSAGSPASSGELNAQQRAQVLAMLNNFGEEVSAASSENLQQVVRYFEQQRERDMQLMEAGYQQLLDSDYQTIQSVQQLVSYVQSE